MVNVMRANVLRVSVLGPLEVHIDGVPMVIGSPRQRMLLAALLCRPGRVVPADMLRDAVWQGAASANNLQVYVHRLRGTLRDPSRIAHRPPGYALQISADECDAARFDVLVERGERTAAAGDPDGAAALYREALALWHGEAFAGLDGPALVRDEALRLSARRVSVLERVAGSAGRATVVSRRPADIARRPTLPEPFPRIENERGGGLLARARRLAAVGDHRRAIVVARAALHTASRETGTDPAVHEVLGVCLREQGHLAGTHRHLSAALTGAIAGGDPAAEARALQLLGIVAREQGRFDASARLLARAGALYRDLDDAVHQACLLLATAELRHRAGDRLARRDLAEGLGRCRELGVGFGIAYGLRLRGEQETPARAVPVLRDAVRLSEATGSTFMRALAWRALARAHAAAGHAADAANAATRAGSLFRKLGGAQGMPPAPASSSPR